ncbi:GntR family transcriptional regulator [Bacterioplanes sanyensis]|uniref:GntR family transcriptional regulator n=1 Tax=Bacterioplanes sanyensis TaxID=1249553 RepID=A0A222FPU3_9GAMM|nr:S1-like domain-containing RNA-binding protein [Bacterioplanes sanyensis]ASP40534.1 GntR family transcriptional regulator [Bacterioplanes sanyensis]
MAELGRTNTLTVVELASQGAYLDDDDQQPILLPNNQCPEGIQVGDELSVFVYLDSDDRWIATRQRPRAQVGQVANLEVKDVNAMGAFLDWGLAKDLLVPFSEQKQKLQVGQQCQVYVSIDNTGRLIGSTRLNRFIKDEAKAQWPGADDPYNNGDRVKLLISQRTDLGYKAVVDDQFWGVLHNNDVRTAVRPGQRLTGFIKRVRDDGRLDLSLEPVGKDKVNLLADRILDKLKQQDGRLWLSDQSSPEEIEQQLGVSKRAFKATIGRLLKLGKIRIEDQSIALNDAEPVAGRQPQGPKPPSKQARAAAEQLKQQSAAQTPSKKIYRNPRKSAKTLSLSSKKSS